MKKLSIADLNRLVEDDPHRLHDAEINSHTRSKKISDALAGRKLSPEHVELMRLRAVEQWENLSDEERSLRTKRLAEATKEFRNTPEGKELSKIHLELMKERPGWFDKVSKGLLTSERAKQQRARLLLATKQAQENSPFVACPHCHGDVKQIFFTNHVRLCSKNPKREDPGRSDLVQCPHCHKTGQWNGMKQWHFDYCLKNPEALPRKHPKAVNHTPEVREKISKANKGKKLSPEHAAKFLAGRRNTPVTDETRERMRQVKLGRPKPRTTCPHCGKEGARCGLFFKHHFDNCKQNSNKEPS